MAVGLLKKFYASNVVHVYLISIGTMLWCTTRFKIKMQVTRLRIKEKSNHEWKKVVDMEASGHLENSVAASASVFEYKFILLHSINRL